MKIVKNITLTLVKIKDTGVEIPAESHIVIPPQDYLLWAASENVISLLAAEIIVISDGTSDLSTVEAIEYLGTGSSLGTRFTSLTDLMAKNTRDAVEEVNLKVNSLTKFEDRALTGYAGVFVLTDEEGNILTREL